MHYRLIFPLSFYIEKYVANYICQEILSGVFIGAEVHLSIHGIHLITLFLFSQYEPLIIENKICIIKTNQKQLCFMISINPNYLEIRIRIRLKK